MVVDHVLDVLVLHLLVLSVLELLDVLPLDRVLDPPVRLLLVELPDLVQLVLVVSVLDLLLDLPLVVVYADLPFPLLEVVGQQHFGLDGLDLVVLVVNLFVGPVQNLLLYLLLVLELLLVLLSPQILVLFEPLEFEVLLLLPLGLQGVRPVLDLLIRQILHVVLLLLLILRLVHHLVLSRTPVLYRTQLLHVENLRLRLFHLHVTKLTCLPHPNHLPFSK